MRVYSCENPKVVRNKYTGQFVTAPCGHCSACLDARAANWVQRLDFEQYFTKHTWFITLQYDEQHVPQLVRLRMEDYNSPAYIDLDTGLLVDYYDKSVNKHSKKDLQYIYDTKVLNVVSVRDIQLFIKSLRQYAKRKYNANFRYFVTLEYGPQTFRCHAHMLLFTNSTLFSQDLERVLPLYWKYGCVFDPHPVSGSASEYVASYVNSFTSLPAIYSHKEIRQRSLFSKNPPIGAGVLSSTSFREIFDTCSLQLRCFSPTKNKFVNVPLWRFIQDRLFPRLQRFALLSRYERIALYRLISEARRECLKYDIDFTTANVAYYLQYRYIFFCPANKSWIRDYFKSILFEDKVITLTTDNWKKTSMYFGYWYRTEREYQDKVSAFNYESLLRFCRVIMRVYLNSQEFNIPLTDYVHTISDYYDKKSVSQLSNWLSFQQDYFEEHDVKEYLCFDCSFVNAVNGRSVVEIQPWQKFLLDFYGYSVGIDGLYHLSVSYVFDYNDLVKTHQYINFQNTKTKKTNDYLLKHSDKFKNVINYYESF